MADKISTQEVVDVYCNLVDKVRELTYETEHVTPLIMIMLGSTLCADAMAIVGHKFRRDLPIDETIEAEMVKHLYDESLAEKVSAAMFDAFERALTRGDSDDQDS